MPIAIVACLHLWCNSQSCCFLIICISMPLEPLKSTFAQKNHTKNLIQAAILDSQALKHTPPIVKVACLNLSCNLQTCYFLLNCIPVPLEPSKSTFAQRNLTKKMIVVLFCCHKALKHNMPIAKFACLHLMCNSQSCCFVLICISVTLEPLSPLLHSKIS